MIVSASAAEPTMERQLEMEHEKSPETLLHEAVEEAVEANPRLVLEPYYQMKAAAIILAKRCIALTKCEDEFVDECGPLPTCQFCHLAVGVCECPKSHDAASLEASGWPRY